MGPLADRCFSLVFDTLSACTPCVRQFISTHVYRVSLSGAHHDSYTSLGCDQLFRTTRLVAKDTAISPAYVAMRLHLRLDWHSHCFSDSGCGSPHMVLLLGTT